jgi:hypothetical protein
MLKIPSIKKTTTNLDEESIYFLYQYQIKELKYNNIIYPNLNSAITNILNKLYDYYITDNTILPSIELYDIDNTQTKHLVYLIFKENNLKIYDILTSHFHENYTDINVKFNQILKSIIIYFHNQYELIHKTHENNNY